MAPLPNHAAAQSAPTRPRLQSVNQDFSTLHEQIRQVAHIIRLPEDWANTEDEFARSSALRHVVRARAEWVLRWVLDKLKDDTDLGAEARALPTAWQLLECMLYMLPVSRSAPHLRDAGFTTILERTLVETFDKDIDSLSGPANGSAHARDASESSETVYDDAQPSRKRKRASPGTAPSKRTALGVTDPVLLFRVVKLTLQSITGLTAASTNVHDTTQTELMKMVLRTESAQAARILKFWLIGVQKLVASASQQDMDSLVELSVVLDIWELRIVDANDNSGSSSEDFANECLVPTLQLAETLKTARPLMAGQPTRVLDQTAQALDRLLTRHILAPARSAFFAETHTEAVVKGNVHKEATDLSSSLGPLRAMLLQAIQMEDAGEAIPSQFAASFKAVGGLLDLAIRASPSRTPKSRLAERPWIQAVFVSLAECVACSLKTPPELATSKAAVVTLQSALEVLQSHAITIDSATLKNVFWYHCGVKYPQTEGREVHWTLIAALIDLDASIFVTTPRSASQESGGHSIDLVEFLFDQISHTEFKGAGFVNLEEGTGIDTKDNAVITDARLHADRQLILKRIIAPIMSAYSRNRNLLGFLRRWDDQLVKNYKPANRKALKEGEDPIWEDRLLTRALTETFEQSLTHDQIAKLVEEHAQRMDALGDAMTTQADEDVNIRKLAAYKKATSSALLIPAVLQSIQSDDVVIALRPQLHSLFVSYAARVQDDRYSAYTRLDFSWTTLCQLMAKLWPIEMHASLQLQQQLLHPLMEQATKDVSTSRKDLRGRCVDSQTRAAAILFLLDSCNRVQTVPGSEEQVRECLSRVVGNLSESRLEASEYTNMVEIFCANFVQLLGHMDAPSTQQSLLAMLTKLSLFEDNVGDNIVGSLSQSIFSQGTSALHSAYTSALSDALGQTDDSGLHHVTVQALRQVQPSALSREKREVILDRISTLASSSPYPVGLLSLMVQLMEVPNASAKVSVDGGIIFDIAAQVQKQGVPSRTLLQQLQSLCQRVLGHIIPNQSQAQSRAFLGEFQKKLNTLTEGKKKKASSASLAILRATVLEQKDSQLLSLKQYVGLLKQCLTDDGTDASDTASFEDLLDAFNEVFPALLADPSLLKATTAWLRNWISENADLESYVNSTQTTSIEVAEFVAQLHKLVAKYKLYPDSKWLVALTVKLLCGPLDAEPKRIALATITEALTPLETADKLSLVPHLAGVSDPLLQTASYNILKDLISTLPDKVSTDAALKKEQLAILPRLCYLLADTSNEASFNALMNSIDTILNNKASLTTQHSIECVLTVLVKLTSRTSPPLSTTHAPHIFTRLCETSRLLLLVHRAKSGGRSHLLLPLLQGLLFCLFMPTSARSGALPAWLRSTTTTTAPITLTPTNAAQYTRLLSTLCNPPQSTISKAHQRSSRNLTDPLKLAREKTSHFLYPLLASLCRFQLSGRLLPDVRTKLMPGLWEVVGTASLSKDGLDAMFAGLSRSEKDVWRSVWGEWESVHGRKERFVSAGAGDE